jgi:hypothetical protein
VRASSLDDLLAVTRDGPPSMLEPFNQHLHDRWKDGCRSAAQLFTEIRTFGYRGSYGTVREYVQPFRTLDGAPRLTPRRPKVREVTGWMLRHPDSRKPDQPVKLKQVLTNCPYLAAAARHVMAFAEIMTDSRGETSTDGSTRSVHTTFRCCTLSRQDCNAITRPWSTASPCRTAPVRSGRGQRQPYRGDQAADVWPCQL